MDAASSLTFLLADGDGNLLTQDVSARAVSMKKRRYRYRNADKSLSVKVRSRDGRRYKVSVTGKRLTLHAADAAPILTTVGMGSHTVSAVLTRCNFQRHGKRLVCTP